MSTSTAFSLLDLLNRIGEIELTAAEASSLYNFLDPARHPIRFREVDSDDYVICDVEVPVRLRIRKQR